jgi:hypothetical protein
MAKTFQLRRYSSTDLAALIPGDGEVMVNLTTKSLVVGDGATQGGNPVGGGAGITGQKGRVNLTQGETSVTVSGLGLGFTPTDVLVTVITPAGAEVIAASVEDGFDANGFTANLSGAPDQTGYRLSYLML